MHNEDYIASGMLELYAAGALSQEERQDVERMAAASPEVRVALDEACEAMENYARLHAVQPRPSLKASIMEQIAAQPPDGFAPANEPEETPVVPMYPPEAKEASPYKWMFAASIVLFLVSGFMSYNFYQKWQQAEDRLAQALASGQQLAQNYNTASSQLAQQEQLLTILRDEAYQPVRLQGVEAHPGASVMVYWSPQRRQVYLDVRQLPPPPAGQQYQLWALNNGQPIDAGMLSLDGAATGLQQMKEIGAAQAFAITLEPEGGSVNPTLEQLFVMGEV